MDRHPGIVFWPGRPPTGVGRRPRRLGGGPSGSERGVETRGDRGHPGSRELAWSLGYPGPVLW